MYEHERSWLEENSKQSKQDKRPVRNWKRSARRFAERFGKARARTADSIKGMADLVRIRTGLGLKRRAWTAAECDWIAVHAAGAGTPGRSWEAVANAFHEEFGNKRSASAVRRQAERLQADAGVDAGLDARISSMQALVARLTAERDEARREVEALEAANGRLLEEEFVPTLEGFFADC